MNWRDVGGRVRARREELGLTQKQAASQAGLSEATWANIEAGKHQGSYKRLTLLAVCQTLGWTLDSFDRLEAGDNPIVAPTEPVDPVADEISQLRQRIESLEQAVREHRFRRGR